MAEDTARLGPREPLQFCRRANLCHRPWGARGDSEGEVAIKKPTLVAECCGAASRSREEDSHRKEASWEGLSEVGRDGKARDGRGQGGVDAGVRFRVGLRGWEVGRVKRVRMAAISVQGEFSLAFLALAGRGQGRLSMRQTPDWAWSGGGAWGPRALF